MNGLIEEAGKTTREYARVFISQIEEGIGEEVEAGTPLFLWQLDGQQYATQDMLWGEMEGRGMKG